MKEIINIDCVSKRYRRKTSNAINNFSLSVQEGEIVGFLGPNGAGKSTLIKMMLGVLSTSMGEIEIFCKDPMKFSNREKMQIGVYMGGKSGLIYHLPVLDSLKLVKTIYKVPNDLFEERVKYYSAILNCEEILNCRVATLSLGQKLKAELMCILCFKPRIFILDEPTLGLDIDAKRSFREIIKELVEKEKITVIITSHDVNDIKKICSRIIFINAGEKKWDKTSDEIERHVNNYDIISCRQIIEYNDKVKLIEKVDDNYRYLVEKSESKELMTKLNCSYCVEGPTLEDILYEYYR